MGIDLDCLEFKLWFALWTGNLKVEL